VELTQDNFSTVIGLPEIVNDFKELYGKVQEPTLYYDTTFCLGDRYVSCLLYRHTVLASSLIVPLLALVHERRPKESYQLLFSWF